MPKKQHKSRAARVGGTAVPGAKSLQPKQVPTNTNANEPVENYNRDMRRRMKQMKTGPYAQEEHMQTLQQQRQKKIDRRKQRLEEQRADLRKSLPGGKITLGRRNTYFLIAVAALVILLIVLAIVLKQLHVI